MRIILNALLITFVSFGLSACDGFEYDSNTDLTSTDQRFTRSELGFNVLFSSLLLNDSGFSNNREGFIVLFKTTANLDEIELRSNNNALVGEYDWTIVNDELQVSYLNGVTCTSNKTSESGLQYTADSRCDGGEPNNARIEGTLNKLVAFEDDDLFERTVIIENDDNDQRIDFFSNGSFEITDIDVNGDEIDNTFEVGTYTDSSIFNNTVRLENSDPSSDEYSLLMLLEGSLAEGTLLQLRYVASTNALSEVRIYDIDSNNNWDVDSNFDDIDIDE